MPVPQDPSHEFFQVQCARLEAALVMLLCLVAVFEAQDGEPEFEKVFQLMQQMQTFGHPPKDLIGNSDAFQAQLPPASGIPDCPVQ